MERTRAYSPFLPYKYELFPYYGRSVLVKNWICPTLTVPVCQCLLCSLLSILFHPHNAKYDFHATSTSFIVPQKDYLHRCLIITILVSLPRPRSCVCCHVFASCAKLESTRLGWLCLDTWKWVSSKFKRRARERALPVRWYYSPTSCLLEGEPGYKNRKYGFHTNPPFFFNFCGVPGHGSFMA